jgi:hypothetical protein
MADQTDEILRRLDSHSEKLTEIKVQVEKTNGRVGALERWIERAKGIVGLVVLLVPAVLTYLATH